MRSWFHRITHLGTAGMDPQDAKYVINTNIGVLIAESVTLPYGPIYLFVKVDYPGLIFWVWIGLILFYPCIWLLNSRCNHFVAKHSLMMVGGFHIFMVSQLLPRESGLSMYILACLIFPFLIYGPKEKFFIVLSEVLLAALYFAAYYCSLVFPPILTISPEMLPPFFLMNSVLIMIFLTLQGYYFYSTNLNVEKTLVHERERSENLLLNILPAGIAAELKQQGKSFPKQFESVTVLFTDFQGFTSAAENMPPDRLVSELDSCFSYFDSLMDQHHMEKLKTIGDAYMCVGGLPQTNHTHAIDAVLVALKMRDFVQSEKEKRSGSGASFWDIRIGIHTGPLVAGVIGDKKFAYDVWGDTVNTASRMESTGEAGKINISGAVHDRVKQFFVCTPRGRIAVKNKEPMEMFFVDSIKTEFSDERGGPGESFFRKLQDLRKP